MYIDQNEKKSPFCMYIDQYTIFSINLTSFLQSKFCIFCICIRKNKLDLCSCFQKIHEKTCI